MNDRRESQTSSVGSIIVKRLLLILFLIYLLTSVILFIVFIKYGVLSIKYRIILAVIVIFVSALFIRAIIYKSSLFRFLMFILGIVFILGSVASIFLVLKGDRLWRQLYSAGISEKVEQSNKDTSKESINIYIAGVDNSGNIEGNSRCDVNIIMTINPKTKKILLTTTPRDSYIAIGGDHSKYDKLTHAGVYGVGASMKALEDLYEIKLDYFIKVNFRTFQGLVDSIGGVDVNIEKDFTSNGSNIEYKKGKAHLDGKEALGFVRERYAFKDGDLARAKHQQEVLKAIFKKLMSTASITHIDSVSDALKGNMSTNIPSKGIFGLASSVISFPISGFSMENQSVYGSGRMDLHSYAMPNSRLYMMVLDNDVVLKARQKILDVMRAK